MILLFVILLSIIFLSIAGIHFYWALGGKKGTLYVIPEKEGRPLFSPKPLGTVLVGFTFLFFVLIVMEKAGIIFFVRSGNVVNYILIGMTLIFLIRAIGDFKWVGFFKKNSTTQFAYWDQKLFSPLCVAIACFLLAILLIK